MRDVDDPRPGTEPLDRTFEAIILDWDGTVVPDRSFAAGEARRRLEELCSLGVHVVIVSGTHLGNVDGQLGARPKGDGTLHCCTNRGSEVFAVGADGPELLVRRVATPDEDRALDRAAALAVERLRSRGVEAEVVSQRLNRRKIDLIPTSRWADPKKAEMAELTEAVLATVRAAGFADLAEVVDLVSGASRDGGLRDPKITSDVKHVELGLTDKADSARWAARWLAERGVTGGLVLIVGDELGPVGGMVGSDSLLRIDEFDRSPAVSVGVEPGGVPDDVIHLVGGPDRCLAILDAQLLRRRQRRVPGIDLDPSWVVELPGDRDRRRVAEALGTVGNGYSGTRASLEEDGPGTDPLLLVSGAYTSQGALLAGPTWTSVDLPPADVQAAGRRWLDLRTAVLWRDDGAPGRRREAGQAGPTTTPPPSTPVRSLRFAPAQAHYALGMRLEGPSGLDPGPALRPPVDGNGFELADDAGVTAAATGHADARITVAAHDQLTAAGGRTTLERLAGWSTIRQPRVALGEARDHLEGAASLGFDRLLAEHRREWAQRWARAEVTIEGDPDAELAARFAVYHLLTAAADTGELAVGARGLSGSGYAGHVFWDADVFVLPALVALRPAAALCMLRYRIARLPAARAFAASLGYRGARFPWESDGDGRDVTPRQVRTPLGETVEIETGPREEHVVADVAWAAEQYATWTGSGSWLRSEGRDLVVETARYWASRITTDDAGTAHLDGVIGPDEYHDDVDDNAYTNVMARWNLRCAASLLDAGNGDAAPTEAVALRSLADRLVDGWDAGRGIYEQFRGYFDLEPLLLEEVATPPVLLDLVIGGDRVAHSQLIKQADVLMLHHLVPDEVVAGSLTDCLAHYLPRTAHGSSLSPAVHAALLARAGRPEEALELFAHSSRIDLDDVMGATAEGVHLAAMAGVWQALAFGFLGIRCRDGVLVVDPCLPDRWSALTLGLSVFGQAVRVRAEHGKVTVWCERPLAVRVAGSAPTTNVPPSAVYPVDTHPGRQADDPRTRPLAGTLWRRPRPDPAERGRQPRKVGDGGDPK